MFQFSKIQSYAIVFIIPPSILNHVNAVFDKVFFLICSIDCLCLECLFILGKTRIVNLEIQLIQYLFSFFIDKIDVKLTCCL